MNHNNIQSTPTTHLEALLNPAAFGLAMVLKFWFPLDAVQESEPPPPAPVSETVGVDAEGVAQSGSPNFCPLMVNWFVALLNYIVPLFEGRVDYNNMDSLDSLWKQEVSCELVRASPQKISLSTHGTASGHRLYL